MVRRRRSRKSTRRQVRKVVEDPNIMKLHKHTSRIMRSDKLRDILVKDKLQEFIDSYDNSDNLKKLSKCITNKKCMELSAAECVLEYNQGTIARYVIKKYKIDIYGLLILIRQLSKKKSKSDALKKLFIDSMLYTNLTQNEAAHILTKLIMAGEWDLVDLFHMYGYKVNDINRLINKIPENKFQMIFKFGYKLNDIGILSTIINNKQSYDKKLLEKIGVTKELIVNTENRLALMKIYKTNELEMIKYIEERGFVCDEKCLDYAVSGMNFPVIFHILNNHSELHLEDSHIYQLLFLPVPETRKKTKKGSNIKRRVRSRYRRYRSNYKIANDIKNMKCSYNDSMIEILNKYISEKQTKIVEKVIKRTMINILNAHCFSLYKYLQEHFNFSNDIKKCDAECLIRDIIRVNDVKTLKRLFETKVILPIDVSSNSDYMNTALRCDATEMIKYLHEELKMICGSGISRFFKYCNVSHKKMISNLEMIDYPINSDILNILCKKGKFDIIKNLIEKGYEAPASAIEYALINKKYNLVQYLIDHGCKFTKKNMIDRLMVKSLGKKRRFYRYRFGGGSNKMQSITQINYLIKLGCTATSKSSSILAQNGLFNIVIHLYKKFGIKPSDASLLNFFDYGYMRRKETTATVIKALDYISEEMGVKFLENVEQYTLTKIVNDLLDSYTDQPLLLKYVVDKSKIKLDTSHLNVLINYRDNFKMSKMLIEDYGVVPSKDTFIKAMTLRGKETLKYLSQNYKFDVTLKDIHNMIITHWVTLNIIENVVDDLKIKLSPFTLKLIVDRNLNRWNRDLIQYVLDEVKEITQEIYDKIMNSDVNELKKILTNGNYKIVDYQPTEDELPDQNFIVNDYDSDSDSDSEEHNANDDYIKQVVGDIANKDIVDDGDDDEDDEDIDGGGIINEDEDISDIE